jgi:hypothetical protein
VKVADALVAWLHEEAQWSRENRSPEAETVARAVLGWLG